MHVSGKKFRRNAQMLLRFRIVMIIMSDENDHISGQRTVHVMPLS